MELNPNGTVKLSSVREVKRVVLKPLENQSIKYRLSVTRGRVRLGEIAVIGDRQWLKVNPVYFNGAMWLEIENE